jgi:hypothetical protein
MDLNFAAILASVPGAAFRILNTARPPNDALLNTFLPEQMRATYDAKTGNMTITATMAGLVGMDSSYPPGGAIAARTWREQTAKVAQDIPLPEASIRELHALLQAMGTDSTDQIARDTVLNFVDKVLGQAQLDTAEYMRGLVLSTGKLQWTFGGIKLDVDYGIPAANLFAQRTGTDYYGGSTSKFWTDVALARTKLKNSIRAMVASPATIDLIISNAVNNVILTTQDMVTGSAGFVQNVGASNGPLIPSPDLRKRASIIGYGSKGAVLDPTNPSVPKEVPFIPDGVVIVIGNPISGGFRVGTLGNEPNPLSELPIGYTHIGPTVEGGGRPGRWGDLVVPENSPYMVRGRTACNLLPVIEANDKLVVMSTAMS